AVKLQNNEL
nr:Chain B, ALA-VAL-LYS-LEU-GLN-ASN-ASN-GLU [Severe acute respiratory syndrome coronavirus 2]